MRKQFQPGANVPMVTETHRRLALELRLSTENLIARPSPQAFNQLSKMLAALCSAGMTGDALERASSTMCLVCDRFERVGKVGLKEDEAQALRSAMAGIDADLPRIPVNKFKRAVAQVAAYCITVGA